jgi:outer membrane protein assembly factor BamB
MNYFRIFILILCLLRIVIAQNPNEWPIVHNLGHTGFSPTTQLRPPLQVKWTAKLQGNFKNGPVVAEGKLVVKSNRGYVFCLDAETGELVWRHFVPFVPGIRISEGAGNINVRGPSAPGIFNGRVYVNFHTAGYPEISGLRCFDLETGEEKWRVKAGFVPNWLRYSPQVSKGKLFFISHLPIKPSPDNRRDTCFRPFVQVWDAETGDSLWTYAMWDTACPTISLLAAGDTVFASASDAGGQGKTVALDLDGNVLWTNPDYSCTGTATIQYLDDKIVLNDT